MKQLSKNPTDTEKLMAATACIKAIVDSYDRTQSVIPSLIESCKSFLDGDWEQFAVWEPEDQPAREELINSINKLIDALENRE